MKKREINKLDLAALIVSIAAIGIATWQGSTQVELQKSSLRPYLSIELLKADSEPKKGFLIRNAGNGPAVIESFKLYKNEEEYLKKISHEEWLSPGDTSEVMFMGLNFEDINNLTPGYVISNQSRNELFLLGTTADTFYNTQTALSMENVIIEIEYRSILRQDRKTYYLKFCERFKRNNIDRKTRNEYE